MTYSPAGLELTKHFEGCRLEAYQDQGGLWTIGYGHVHKVKMGDTCTEADADGWLRLDMCFAEDSVNELVRVPLLQCQFDALCDFTFNLGHSALEKSQLLRLVNAHDFTAAAAEFPKWNKVRINGVLTPDKGLTRRRLAEQAMFEGRDWREL